jgi:hypothetical protein
MDAPVSRNRNGTRSTKNRHNEKGRSVSAAAFPKLTLNP